MALAVGVLALAVSAVAARGSRPPGPQEAAAIRAEALRYIRGLEIPTATHAVFYPVCVSTVNGRYGFTDTWLLKGGEIVNVATTVLRRRGEGWRAFTVGTSFDDGPIPEAVVDEIDRCATAPERVERLIRSGRLKPKSI